VPAGTRCASEELQVWPRRTALDDLVELVGLARVLALALGDQVHLAAARRERAVVLAAHAEQHELGDLAEVEADAPAVRAAVAARLEPDEVGLVVEAPGGHHAQALGEQRVRHPEVEV
jgi:hypothetical protein